ncbi:DUF1656 domain-containing protein [Salinisphaera sp. Q1T1-3]|uniref:DUF1656 domain-containing protein n=1 Tax=Salinisphaera sp. Q1T1-3 TaxID=2321229 RepID=UPI0018F30884|nr:DUF1656 domain-containing protein [Salinisphaera sp. Q1T1-3]
MLPETIAIGGIYLPIFLGFLVATGLLYLALRWVLLRVHAYRAFWHPALAGAALFTILLSGLLLLFGP